MLLTAVLPESEVIPAICNALLEIDNSERHIQAMIDNALFDNPAFAEFLRYKLKQQQDDDDYRQWCLKAANTLAANSRSKQAIGLYVQAGAYSKSARLLEAYGREFYDKGRALELYGWLDQMGETLKQWPKLLLLKGKILNSLGKPKQALAISTAPQMISEIKYVSMDKK